MTDLWAAHQRARFMRPDAWRYVKPGTPGCASMPGAGYQEPAYTRAARVRAALAAKAELARTDAEERAFRYELAALRFELILLKALLHTRRARWQAKAGFDPNQPRVPAGNPDGGQWTDGEESIALSARSKIEEIYAAGLVPRIPQLRPPTSGERTAIAKVVSIFLAEVGVAAGEFIAENSWLYQAIPSINSYLDAPRALSELQSDLTAKAGYDIHHIVERASALADGYWGRAVNDPDNLVRIPRMKHWEINGWYQTPNADFGEISPREYLRGKDWDERRRLGLMALEKFGVLQK